MNPAPSWPDLHYVDTEQVELDVPAIIARGARIRRRRLLTKVAAVALVIGVVPAVVIADMTRSVVAGRPTAAPRGPARTTAGRGVPGNSAPVGAAAAFGPVGHVKVPAALGTADSGSVSIVNGQESTASKGAAVAGGNLMFSLARAVVRRATTLPARYGPLLALAGAGAGSGVWFTATAARLTLFRLSMAGALSSWPLPAPASSVRASAGVGLAVTAAGVAWIGVGPTLLRLDTKSSRLRTWQVPARGAGADSVAVSQDGRVAVAMSDSSSVQVLYPREGTFRRIELPDAVDRPLAVGYARNGTLGIGYKHPGVPRAEAVLLVTRTGARRSAGVPRPTAVAPYGASGLLVGVTELTVVPERGHPRSLALPADQRDFGSRTPAPALLPGDRLAIAMDTAILTFPATTSSSVASARSQLSVIPSPRCQPHRGCPAGYQLLTTDSDGDLWVVPKAGPRTVELISLR